MSETDLEARIAAVERALTDGDVDLAAMESADVAADVDELEERLATVEQRLDDLDAAVQAVRGYAGNVRAVNREVERRASAALAKAETLESAVQDGDLDSQSRPERSPERRAGATGTSERPHGRDRENRREFDEHLDHDGDADHRHHEADEYHRESDGRQRDSGRGPHPGHGNGRKADGKEDDTGRREHHRDRSRRGSERDGREGADRRDVLGRSDLDIERLREDRSNGEGDGDSASDQSTAQFIERVRDVL